MSASNLPCADTHHSSLLGLYGKVTLLPCITSREQTVSQNARLVSMQLSLRLPGQPETALGQLDT